jgi:hypothetical protein
MSFTLAKPALDKCLPTLTCDQWLAHAFLTILKASFLEVKKGEIPAQNSLFEFKKRRGLYYL